jgi:hypothetical protein
MCVCVCVCELVCPCVCVCVCVCAREIDREFVWMCVQEREGVCLCDRVCSVYVCARESERERECV